MVRSPVVGVLLFDWRVISKLVVVMFVMAWTTKVSPPIDRSVAAIATLGGEAKSLLKWTIVVVVLWLVRVVVFVPDSTLALFCLVVFWAMAKEVICLRGARFSPSTVRLSQPSLLLKMLGGSRVFPPKRTLKIPFATVTVEPSCQRTVEELEVS